ncbi:uncharacterized protein LOC129582599 isoform X2 [Paramacrobiotus metropolitanus]|nr:uncharacterized protein LOC129582599 isoform X2 [Paramacrobiotus metropolitanus]
MANLPSGLMTTAAKADKKPFSYTPVGLSAADLRAPSSIRKDKLDAIASGEEVPTPGVVPGIPRGPTNVRIFNGITPPASSFDNSGVVRNSPLQARKGSLSRQDSGGSGSDSGLRSGRVAPIQSRSFKILQWMTGADEDDDSILAGTASPPASKPSQDTDEMRFSGYHRADSIPSRAYQTLEKNVAHHAAPGAALPGGDQQTIHPFRDEAFRTEFNEETGSNARYTGNAIPSRSFRALQSMTGQPNELHAAPPSPTVGRRSPNPAIVQPHYNRNMQQSPVNIAPPNRQDFKYQGPQYSTYDLPPAQHHNYAPSPGIMSSSTGQPRYSSSVTLTPGGGDHRRPDDYADQSSTYRPAGNGYAAHPQNAYHAAPASPSYPSPNYQNYSQPAQYQMPARNVPMAGAGHFAGAGRSDF